MAIKFNPSLITFKYIKLKSLSIGNGGQLKILDEELSTEHKDIFYTLSVQPGLCTMWGRKYKAAHYFKPCEAVACMYGDTVIALEKSTFGTRFVIGLAGLEREWIPNMKLVYNQILEMIGEQEMYFDGTWVYSFRSDIDQSVMDGDALNEDGSFRNVIVDAIKMSNIGYVDDIFVEHRNCLAYVTETGEYEISPPVWKNLGSVGESNIKAASKNDNDNLNAKFDEVDTKYLVNLDFALIASNVLSKQFGYRIIEPMQLPKLMLQLKTVNLPNIAPEVRKSYDIGITYTQTLSWLLGVQNKYCTTIDHTIKMRNLFKYITGRGIYLKSLNEVLLDGYEPCDIPLMSIEQAMGGLVELEQKRA